MKKVKLSFTARELTLMLNGIAAAHAVEHDAADGFALAMVGFQTAGATCDDIIALGKRLASAAQALEPNAVSIHVRGRDGCAKNDPLTS